MRKYINLNITVLTSLLLFIIVSCGKSSSGSYNNPASGGGNTGNTISIIYMAYTPSTLTVTKGIVVTWTNKDGTTHTVTSNDGGVTFDSGNISDTKSFSYTANTVGTFQYHCTIHGLTMAGTLKVNP